MVTAKFCKLQIYKSFPGCQDISRDISFLLLLPLSSCLLQHLLSATSLFQDVETSHVTSAICSPCLHALTAASSSSLHHSSSAAVSPLLQHLLVASISHHQQQQSPPQNRVHTTPPQNHESCIHRFLLPYIVSIMHNTTIAYIVFYYS